jgi:tRNA-Thr(GGU) m(6)t(6)A37 methyltransferase TsaA
MQAESEYVLRPIGIVRSELKDPESAPMQGYEGAPDAWVEMNDEVADGLRDVAAGQDVILITWFHEAGRDVLLVHPRSDTSRPLSGVFATRSPDRPNPLGLHRVRVLEVDGSRLKVGPLEAIDGTPVVDIKPVLFESADA